MPPDVSMSSKPSFVYFSNLANTSFRIGSRLEKTEWQVLFLVLTGFFEIFVMIFSVDVKIDTSSENEKK